MQAGIDILAHPGHITKEDVLLAKENNVCLEITTRCGHNATNKEVASLALECGAKLVLNTDSHEPENLMDKTKIDPNEINKHLESYDFDTLKLDYIKKFIEEVGRENIIIIISPRWYGMDESSYEPLVDICKEREVMFLDYSDNSKYVHNDLFFRDGNHLNARGADEFTRDLIKKIKILEQSK